MSKPRNGSNRGARERREAKLEELRRQLPLRERVMVDLVAGLVIDRLRAEQRSTVIEHVERQPEERVRRRRPKKVTTDP